MTTHQYFEYNDGGWDVTIYVGWSAYVFCFYPDPKPGQTHYMAAQIA